MAEYIGLMIVIIICPIAIAYSMGQIIKSVCICQCICPSSSTLMVAFLDRFSPKIGTDVKTPKRKNEFVRGQYRTTPAPILPDKTPILGQKVLKTHANIN